MSKIITLNIDVSKIDKERLFEGKKGTYLNAVVFLNDEKDKFGNNGMITEQVSKEEREAGTKGNILGNAKIVGTLQNEGSNASQESRIKANQEETTLPF